MSNPTLIHESGAFHDSEVVECVRDTVYERCHFIDCMVICRVPRVSFVDCTFERCRFEGRCDAAVDCLFFDCTPTCGELD